MLGVHNTVERTYTSFALRFSPICCRSLLPLGIFRSMADSLNTYNNGFKRLALCLG
jgi:hypothetical protein